MAAASAGGSEGVSSHRGQRPQRLQEAAQDENQRSGALHKDRSDEDRRDFTNSVSSLYQQCKIFRAWTNTIETFTKEFNEKCNL